MKIPKRILELFQCIFVGGIIGLLLVPSVLMTIGFVVTAVYQAAGHIVDNGFAPFAALAEVGPVWLVAGPGAGVLSAVVMWQVSRSRSTMSIALLTGLPIGVLVGVLMSRGFILWDQLWIGGSWLAATLATTIVSAWAAKYT